MRVTNLQLELEAFRINDAPLNHIDDFGKLDPISVFVWTPPQNPHACMLTVVVFNDAFVAHFGAMGRPWREFLADTNDDYLGRTLARSGAKGAKGDSLYCRRIARAIIAAVRMMNDKWAQQLNCTPAPLADGVVFERGEGDK